MRLVAQVRAPVGAQAVAAAAHGLDDDRRGAELVPQRADDGVDDVASAGELGAPDLAQELVARDGPALALAQVPEEPVLERRQRHALAVDRELARLLVELRLLLDAELVGDEGREPAVDRARPEVEDDARVLDCRRARPRRRRSGRKPSFSTTGQ